MSRKEDTTPTSPVDWRLRATERGWTTDVTKAEDLATFEERLSRLRPGALRGVRVGSDTLEAWWEIEAHFGGIDRDGVTNNRTVVRLASMVLHHVPRAVAHVSSVSNQGPAWCPAHASDCRPTEDHRCGWTCDGSRTCVCPACLYAVSYGGTVESRLNLVHYPQRGKLKVPLPPMRDPVRKRAKARLKSQEAIAKEVAAKAAKEAKAARLAEHWSRQPGLLGAKPTV